MAHPLLQNSHGNRPAVAVDDLFPEGIVAMDMAAEDRTLLLGTGNGFLIKLSLSGTQQKRERGFDGLRHVAWSDAGRFGAAAMDGGRLVFFDDKLKIRWKVEFTGDVLALAISPFGSHIAVSTEAGRTYIVTSDRKEIGRFETPQALQHLQFLHDRPQLIGAAEFGHLCCHRLNGREEWNVRILNNVGDMSTTGCGTRILLAAFNHGIQVLDETGHQQGSCLIDGVPSRIAAAANRRRMGTITLESRVYWLNFDGDVLWGADLSADPPISLAVGPLADRLFLATQSGRLLQLVW
ncbi:MAG: hypothetical protein R3C59_27150 [Planctomycetaceae bacterium]